MTLTEQIPASTYLITDSRSLVDPADTVFAAIRTELADGHRYIADLYRRGVRTFIAEYIPDECADFTDARFIIVPSVPEALAEIAARRLAGFSNGILVTGSHGKTTFKELLYRALLPLTKVRRSPRSWNSAIGVPLAVWDMTAGDETPDYIITEAGIDGPGQADRLLSVLNDSHMLALITPITDEHDSAFESHVAKIAEKVKLAARCNTVIYADSDPILAETLKKELPEATLIAVTQASHPSVYHALVEATLNHLGYKTDSRALDALPLADKLRSICRGSYGNNVFTDRFTPDIRSLRDAIDFFRRHATPKHRKILFLGTLIEGTPENAADLALKMGIDKVEIISEELLHRLDAGSEFRDDQILLFGETDALFRSTEEALRSAGHDTTLEIDLDAMVHNFNYFRSLVPSHTGIVAMVKASAYGVGAEEVGKALQSSGAAYLAVAVIEEGIALREAGITMPVMVLNPVTNRYPALFAHRLEPAVFSPGELQRLVAEAEACGISDYPVHIKLDTGMHRVGFLADQLQGIADTLAHTRALRVESAFSHLATADCLDMDSYTQLQLDTFDSMTDTLARLLPAPFKRHILNTAGMMRYGRTHSAYDMGRLGIGLYGLAPYDGPRSADLRPVATFRSHIISLKHWPAGTPIGYGCKGRTTEADAIIATVPVGYADGIDRHFSNGNACFVVNGVKCPTIGNICMDLCMVDVTAAPGVKVGDEVEIFGPHMPIERLSDTLGTISYEILTSVAPRVQRVYVRKS